MRGGMIMGLFSTFFDTNLPSNMHKASDKIQFDKCNSDFSDMFNNNPTFHDGVMDIVDEMSKKVNREHPEYDFSSKIFIDEVNKGHTPPGFTWHHDDKPGHMQLVEEETHRKTHHTGGRSKWGGGADARRHGKIDD